MANRDMGKSSEPSKQTLHKSFSKTFYSFHLILFSTVLFSTTARSQSILECANTPFQSYDSFFFQINSLCGTLKLPNFEFEILSQPAPIPGTCPNKYSYDFNQITSPYDWLITQNSDKSIGGISLSLSARENLKISLAKNDAWYGSDKLKHLGVSFLLVLASYYSSKAALSIHNQDALLPSAGVAFLIGFGKEFADDLSATNIFSLKDLLADVVGIISAIVLLSILHH